MRHISLDLIRVTESGAIAASNFIGSGDKEKADKAATDAIRDRLNKMEIIGKIVIGEGKKDNSYGLFKDELVGSTDSTLHNGETYDIAVDPIEGTTPTVNSGPGAMSVIALAPESSLYSTNYFYMNKLAYGPYMKSKVQLSLEDPIETTVKLAATAIGKRYSQFVVCILNRPRHELIIKKLRKLGVRIKLIQDCDVTGAVSTCLVDGGVDLFYGIGGAPEAVISACGVKCFDGDFQAQPVNREDWSATGDVFNRNEIVKNDCIFSATGITDGSLLKGVRWTSHGPITHTLFMRSESGTARWIETQHGN